MGARGRSVWSREMVFDHGHGVDLGVGGERGGGSFVLLYCMGGEVATYWYLYKYVFCVLEYIKFKYGFKFDRSRDGIVYVWIYLSLCWYRYNYQWDYYLSR